MQEKPLVLIRGNVVDGMDFVGPFTTYNEAESYAELNMDKGDTYTIVQLTEPE